MKAMIRRRLVYTAFLIFTLTMIIGYVSLAVAADGPPSRPSAGPSPDPNLTAHSLTYAAGPLDNPLKGFLPFFIAGTNYEAKPLPHSMIFSYFPLNGVMTSSTSCNTFNWAIVEQMLDETASTGRQASIRFYLEYPNGNPANGIPHCLDGNVTYRTNAFWGTTSPDYDDPDTVQALTNFISAFGAQYDGDPRLAYVQIGLIGLWGEWHTWPYDTDTADNYPNYFPTDQTVNTIIDAFDAAFSETKLVIRYPSLGGNHASAPSVHVGFQNDSFGFKEDDGGTLKPMTLPVSMGGLSYAFLQDTLDASGENKWITESMGGEIRPDIQATLPDGWPNGNSTIENLKAAIELSHMTWAMNEEGVATYSATNANVQAMIRLMGYELYVKNSYYNNGVAGSPLKVGVQIENRSVAQFPYPWTVILGLKNSSGTVVKTWDTTWDITQVQPLTIRAFPDWSVGSDPTYLDFGYPLYFEASNLSTTGLSTGDYTLVMRVRNPLEDVTEASVRDNIQSSQPFLPAKKVRFANTTQNADGWLGLGSITLSATATPTNTPTLTPTPGSTVTTLLPDSYTTTSGSSGGQPVANMRVQDQSGSQDDWNKYVEFVSTSPYYAGYRSYTLPGSISPSSITALSVTANYRGPRKVDQLWEFAIYNWSTSSWVTLGDNATAGDWVWTQMTFNASGTFSQYVNGSGQIRIQLRSFNTANNAQLDFEKVVVTSGSSGPTATPTPTFTPTNTPTPTPTPTNTPTSTPTNTPTATPTTAPALVLDNFDGSPSWPGTNDLGNWAGANSFVNGGGSGALSSGALVLQYNNDGWFGSNVTQNISSKTYLVFVIKGAAGGEQTHFRIILGGVEKTFAAFSGDTITTSYKTIYINMSTHGINRTSPGQLQMTFWHGSSGTITIDEIRFE